MMFTPEELERQAYIQGDVKLAAVYADLIDQEVLIAENEELERKVSDMEDEINELEDKISELE